MKQKAENEHLCDAEEGWDTPMNEQIRDEGTDNVADESFENGDNSAKLTEDQTDWKDKYTRLVAEFDNYRKRTLREKMDLIVSGGEDIVKSLLPVIDDIDRAVEAVNTAKDMDAMKEGICLIRQKLTDALRAKGLAEIEAVGGELDTDLHEAVAKVPAKKGQKGKIVDVVQKGYKMKDKVVRFAKVVVGE